MDELKRWKALQKAINDILGYHDAPEAVGSLYTLKALADGKVRDLETKSDHVPWAMVPP